MTDEADDRERWATCVHESGHCTVAFLLGATSGAGPVTAEPLGAFLSGCAFVGSPPPGPRAGEIMAQVYLAGPAAEELFGGGEIPSRAAVDTEPAAAARLGSPERPAARCRIPASLPEREAALLRQHAAGRAQPVADVAAAFAGLEPAYGTGLTGALDSAVWRAAGEVRELLAGDRPRAMVSALATELWSAGTLGAAGWQAILAGVPR